jgi:hypothetical protein
MQKAHGHGPFADGGGDALDRSTPDVASGKDARPFPITIQCPRSMTAGSIATM